MDIGVKRPGFKLRSCQFLVLLDKILSPVLSPIKQVNNNYYSHKVTVRNKCIMIKEVLCKD